MRYALSATIAALLCGSISGLIGFTLGTTAQWIVLPGLIAIAIIIGMWVARY